MKLREAIIRKRLCERIRVDDIGDGEISVYCPSSISEQLYNYLEEKGMNPNHPQRAIWSSDSDDEIIATASIKYAKQEISTFTASVPLPK
jgi:hypothetical protein